jgi:sigma-B regulation protein RsbU (phosphoserine phosphatase)
MNAHILLANLIATQQARLTALAESWLLAGATAFEIGHHSEVLQRWPATSSPAPDLLRAPIAIDGLTVGEMRVAGLPDDAATRARLATEAALLGDMIHLDADLESMTTELIATQDQLLAMYNLTRSTRQHLDIDQLLRALALESVRLVNVGAGFTLLMGYGPARLEYAPDTLSTATWHELHARVELHEQEWLVNDMAAAEHLPPGIDNLFYIPIHIRDGVRAGLGLCNRSEGFSSPDMKLARAIAEQVGARLENLLLFRESLEHTRIQAEMDLARHVQMRLLPKPPPAVAGVDLAAYSRPAHNVGGDFYDIIIQPHRPLIFAVGDVSGKGMPAALLMAMSLNTLRSQARFAPHPLPERILARANNELYDDFTEVGMFATIFFGQYDVASRELHYANAGHAPVIYCPNGGTPTLLEAEGAPVGVLPLSTCEHNTLPMHPNDMLIVATDGINEATNCDGELFGYERLLALVGTLHARSAEQVALAILAEVNDFSACDADTSPMNDDQTIVVLKITAEA